MKVPVWNQWVRLEPRFPGRKLMLKERCYKRESAFDLRLLGRQAGRIG